MWIEEEKGWIKERKERMAREGGFLLLEILRLGMYSLESSKFQCIFSFASYSFYRPKIA